MRTSLSTRISAGFLVVLLAFTGASGVAVVRMRAQRTEIDLIHRGYLAIGRSASQLRTLQEVRDDTVLQALSEQDPAVRARLAALASERTPRAMLARLDEMQGLARGLQAGQLDASDALFLENVFASTHRARDLVDAWDEASERLLDSLGQASSDRDALVDTWQKRSDGFSRELRGLSLALDNRTAEAVRRAQRAEREGTTLAIAVALLAAVVGVLVFVSMLRALRPLRMLVDAVRAVERGALDAAQLPELGDDEVGRLARALNAMAGALRERESALDARSREHQRLTTFAENVIRSVRVGIVVIDGEGRVRSLNPAARSVLQLPLRDVEGQPAGEVLAGPLAPVVDALLDVRTTGEVRAFSTVRVGARMADIALVPIRDRAGASSGDVLLLGDDVTAREEARERVVQSERLAAIGRLAAQITHEIRNPLSSVALNIELLSDDVEHLPAERQAEASSILQAVLHEVSRLTEITEGYLRFSRLPATRRTAGDVGDLLAGLVAFMQPDAARAQVNVELHVESGLPAVAVDADRLRQALLNLLKNALEAAGAGGTVRIGVRHDGADLRIVVDDTGPGIPEADRARIFEPFVTTKSGGTGLGLVVTREIIGEHGGTISAGAGALGGASFTIRLPISDDDARSTDDPRAHDA